MKCKWCPYLAVEREVKGKKRDPFEDLKSHARQAHPNEYRDFERRAWGDKMASYRRIKQIRKEMQESERISAETRVMRALHPWTDPPR